MINCILLFLLLLVSMVVLKCINFPLVIYFLNFGRLFHLQVLLITILPVYFVIFFHAQHLRITLANFFSCFSIKNANLSCKFLVSCDVTSLFINIPLQETIDIALNLIFNRNLNLNITKTELKKLFLFATSQTHFLFNETFYNKIDGVAMLSPLVPVFANIFMGFYKPKWLNEYIFNKPKFYLKSNSHL